MPQFTRNNDDVLNLSPQQEPLCTKWGPLSSAVRKHSSWRLWQIESDQSIPASNKETRFLVTDTSAGQLVQNLVGDCSFISALAICRLEHRMHWEVVIIPRHALGTTVSC